jgi:hypothetical protein
MADALWSARTKAHVQHFAAYLKPFQRAAGSRLFDDTDVALETVQAWILTLRDVPADVLEEARSRVLAEGITWMPKPGDVKRHCVAIVNERRRDFLQRAAAAMAACERCHGSTWTEVELEGHAHVTRCGCHDEAMAIEAKAPKALAAPKAPDEDHDAA